MADEHGLQLRELEIADFKKERHAQLAGSPDYVIMVLEDVASSSVVGTATLAVERKFIHHCGKVGHIEDVVVDSRCRGRNLGQRLITALSVKAKELGCYKVILDCSQANVGFYEKCGLSVKGVQMAQYFE